MSRIRKANEKAIEKTLHFLTDLKIASDNNHFILSTTEMQKLHGISKSTHSICKKLGILDKSGKWVAVNPHREMALQILEVLRQQASKRIDVDFGGDFKSSMDSLISSMDKLLFRTEDSLNRLKTPLLSRALNQSEQSQGNHLFSQVESDESKKFELLKAIASGIHSVWTEGKANAEAIGNTNNFIILATEDLFNKFFKK